MENSATKRKCILFFISETILLPFISGHAVIDHAAYRARVRRHSDFGKVKPVQNDAHGEGVIAQRNDKGTNMIARISPQGSIAREGNYSQFESQRSGALEVAYASTSAATSPMRSYWMPLPDSRMARFVRSHTRPCSIWHVSLLAKRAWRKGNEGFLPDDSTAGSSLAQDLRYWTLAFGLSLLFLGVVSTYVGSKFKVEPQPNDEFVAARGRACWTYCCGGSVMLLSLLTFFATLSLLSPTKSDAREEKAGPKHPGERAFEAGEGVALSVACFALIIMRRRHIASLRISSSLISQFAIRGATLSVLLATILEFLGIFGVNYVSGIAVRDLVPSDKNNGNAKGSILIAAVMMGIVGLVEEFSKAIALLCGTCLNVSALRASQPLWYARPWLVLVESPRGIMLAGLSVGCGFMTMENVGYLLSTGLMYDKTDSVLAERIVRCVIVAVRVGLNLHPWLTGITSARIARICFRDGRNTLSLSCSEFVWALAPSVAMHAIFDFSLLAMPGMLAMLLPFTFWCAAKLIFNWEWQMFEECATQSSDPIEETTPSQDS